MRENEHGMRVSSENGAKTARLVRRRARFGWFGRAAAVGLALSAGVAEADSALKVRVTEPGGTGLAEDAVVRFRVGEGDLEIGYVGRDIRGEAEKRNGTWRLRKIFPTSGNGAKAMRDVNAQLRDRTAGKRRGDILREGDYIPNFALIDQDGRFLQIRQLQGNPFVMNFIFTRCPTPEMCPASTKRMADLRRMARDAGLDELHFVTVSFDPEYDSPGVLRQYAQGYGIEKDNFHLLTGDASVIDDLLHRFGILTTEADGTINHTMATFLIDANGRVAYRKEGTRWEAATFLKKAKQL